jgi:alpha/beta superfamily hydrolase
MGRWDELDSWAGEGMRREVFFFRSGGVDLYGSLHAADPQARSFGVVMCNSWGIEADQANRIIYPLAVSVARAGGAALVFHYPGFGDSDGEPDAVTIDSMAAAAGAAVEEGRRRLPVAAWMLAGFMLGASVACLAADPARADALLLVQPSLRPAEHFDELIGKAKRLAAISRSGDEAVFGYSLEHALLSSARKAEPAVAAALGAFAGPGAVIRCSSPSVTDDMPTHFERIEVDGAWRFGTRETMGLDTAAGGWIARYMEKRDDAEAA